MNASKVRHAFNQPCHAGFPSGPCFVCNASSCFWAICLGGGSTEWSQGHRRTSFNRTVNAMIHARNGRTKSVKMSLWIHATCLVVSVNDLPINQNGLRVSGPSSAPPCLDTVCCFVACFSAHHVHEMVVVSPVFQSQRYNSSCESADRAANTSLGFVLLDTASVYLDSLLTWLPLPSLFVLVEHRFRGKSFAYVGRDTV